MLRAHGRAPGLPTLPLRLPGSWGSSDQHAAGRRCSGSRESVLPPGSSAGAGAEETRKEGGGGKEGGEEEKEGAGVSRVFGVEEQGAS